MTPQIQPNRANSPQAPRPGQLGFDTLDTHNPARPQEVFTAVVLDNLSYNHFYWVQTDNDHPVRATALPHAGGVGLLSYRGYHIYPPGTQVLCYRDTRKSEVYIIAALAGMNAWGARNMADSVQMASGVTFLEEIQHNYLPQRVQPAETYRNYNNHRMNDAYSGETGWNNTLGMGIHLGLTQAYIRASEIAGLWVFYNDHLVRMAAHNYQFWNAARDELAGDDEGENYEVRRSSPYPWEMGGTSTLYGDASRTGATEWKTGETDAPIEPELVDQEGVFRLHQFGGYLGDLERTIVSAPSNMFQGVESLGRKTRHVGLSETVRHANGQLLFKSAKGIHLEKYLYVPVPKRMAAQDDPAGDSRAAGNYDSAGAAGTHDQTEFTYGTTANSEGRFVNLFDMHAWTYNSYGRAGMTYHKKDWYLPQESELAKDIGPAVDKSIYKGMGKQMRLSLPQSLALKIDHRPGHSHRYYRSRSAIDMFDDGSIAITAGDGTQLKMGSGHLEATCQGDIRLRAGRNIESWAPHDFIAKAGNCADVSASKGDVRVKAERNMHVLGGNAHQGGVLIESRSSGFNNEFAGKIGTDVNSSGIILLTRNSQILTYSSGWYTRTIKGGPVTLDAAAGAGNINMISNRQLQSVRSKFQICFNEGTVSIDASLASFTMGRFYCQGTICGVTAVQGGVVQSVATHMATPGEPGPYYDNDTIAWPQGPAQVEKASTIIQKASKATVTASQQVNEQYHADDAVGGQSFIKELGYSCRSDSQYGILDFSVYETQWQHELKRNGSHSMWVEPVVASPSGQPTMPFPGFKTWTGGNSYFITGVALWDETNGYNTDRRYDNPKGATPQPRPLAGSYVVTTQQ